MLGLPLFRADCAALESFRYESDWPFAKPFVVVGALFDGRLSPAMVRSWEQESTKAVEFIETCGGARSMLRDAAMVRELGKLVVGKVHAELRRIFDPEEEEMDRIARGLPPRGI
jgi:surfactin synthase thioesterase subunit